MSKTEEEKGEGEWDQKGPGHQAEAEKWVWQDVGCAQSHSPGNSPNCKGGLACKIPSQTRLSLAASRPRPFTPRRKDSSMEGVLSSPGALEATFSCLRKQQARVDWDFGDHKGAEFPRKSGHYFQLEGTLCEGKDSVHLTYPLIPSTRTAPDPTVPNSIVLNGLELSQALPYHVILEVYKTYFAGFFHNMCPEAVNGDACPTMSSLTTVISQKSGV